jgi:hypothetical protein
MTLVQVQRELREKLRQHPPIRFVEGIIAVGVPEIGQLGWVHGRKGKWISPYTMQCLETGEVFPIMYAIR